jgi:hypothetical protein
LRWYRIHLNEHNKVKNRVVKTEIGKCSPAELLRL